MNRETHKYDDIIDMPHHVSKTRPQMSMHDRAAQFSSFAALVGFDSMIEETERLTHTKVELDEAAKAILNEKLNLIDQNITLHPEIRIVYFLPDERKEGGEYVSHIGTVKKIDSFLRTVIFSDSVKIPIEDIYMIDGEWLRHLQVED
ncbi:MAG: hypothetical protein IJJ15_01040 [Ruminococcus sp.]|nr:hypothetical protein [Ruminococcus sp.]